MARLPRSALPEGYFHVMSRACEGQALFQIDADYRRYLGLLQLTVERMGWRVLTFALMPNHVHLAVRAVPERLSRGLWWLNWQYAEHYKAAYRPRIGHVLGGRPKLKPVQDEAYLFAVIRYIALNPVGSLTDDPSVYRWSAHRALTGCAPRPPMLAVDELLDLFGPGDAAGRYERFVSGEAPLEHGAVRRWTGVHLGRPELETILSDPTPAALLAAHDDWGYPLRAIAAALGANYSAVQRAVSRARDESRGQAP